MDVGLFKLKCGDVLISMYEFNQADSTYTLRKPCIVTHFGKIQPWLMIDSNEDAPYTIHKDDLMFDVRVPRKDVEQMYIERTTGISTPSPQGGLGGQMPPGGVPPTRGGNVPPTRGGGGLIM